LSNDLIRCLFRTVLDLKRVRKCQGACCSSDEHL
jgi:hypothetical protein